MAKAKLSPDYIEWVLKLNATQVQQEYHKLEKANKTLQAENRASRKAMAELEKQGQKNSQEWQNLKKAIKENNKAINENSAKMGELQKKMGQGDMTLRQLIKRQQELKKEFENTSKAADPKRYKELQEELHRLDSSIRTTRRSLNRMANESGRLNSVAESIKGFFFQIGASVLTLVTGAFRDAFNIVVDFEKENSRLAAILGTTRDGIKDLTAAARQLGATTSYSAAEVTQLQIELAKLGFAKQEIIDMEGAVLKFATAVGTDLARASAFTGAALRIFGKDASQAEDVLASFAVATTRTALDFSKLETSLSIVGPVASSFGLTLEDTTALLGQLANAGFDASSAATAARNILLGLADANGDLAKALGQPAKSAEGLAAGLRKLNEEGVDLNKALELTDKRSVSAFSTFLKNADTLAELKDSITNVNAEFNAMSDTMSDNVAGAMAGLRSAAEELVLKISEGTTGPIKDLINGLTSLVRVIGDVIQWMQKYSAVIKTVAVGFASYKAIAIAVTAAQKAWNLAVTLGHSISRVYRIGVVSLHSVMRTYKTATSAAAASQTLLSAAMKATPWGAIAQLVLSAVAAFAMFRSETDKLTASQKAMKEAEERATEGFASQKASIESLVAVAKNENVALAQREAAIKKLNQIVPNYNAHIDKTTGKYLASKKALDLYLDSLRKKLRYEANQKELGKLINEEEKIKREKEKADKEAEIERELNRKNPVVFAPNEVSNNAANPIKALTEAQRKAAKIDKELEKAQKSREEFEEYIKRGMDSGELSPVIEEAASTETAAKIEKNITKPIKAAGAAASETVDKIKELKARLKELRKMDPETDEEYEEIEAEKKKIQKQLKELKGTSSTKKKKPEHEAGTYREDSIDEATAPIDDRHQKAALDINKLKGEISETELAIKKNQELIRYCRELTEALDKMREGVKENHAQTLDKITKEQNGISATRLKAEQDLAKALARQDEKSHEERLAALTAFHEGAENRIKESVLNREITQQEADIFLLSRSKAFHEDQLRELESYYRKVETTANLGSEERRRKLEELQNQIRRKQSEILTDTGQWVEKMRDLSQQPFTNRFSDFDRRRKEAQAIYDAAIMIESALNHDTAALEKAKEAILKGIDREEDGAHYDIRKQLGMTTWQEDFQHEMDAIDKLHEAGEIKEEEYQRKVLEMKMQYAKRYFDTFSQLSGSMFSALQEAEIATSDAKYDVLIQQAKNNGEETAALEEEKENKKLEIQKKYADVNFAIKVSQIIADTAVSIMKAFSDLGPIAGAVAAAMLTATGAAQVVSAKAERDKIKHMSPSSTASGSETASAQRVLNGFSEGGYTGDGERYEVAGVVHKGEYVIPKPIMKDPRVIDAVGMIEALRRNRLPGAGRRSSEGFADGGHTGAETGIDLTEFREAVAEFRETSRNLKAYVVLRDIDRAREEDERARAPFRRRK